MRYGVDFAHGTVLTFGEAGFGAGGSLVRKSHFGMAELVNEGIAEAISAVAGMQGISLFRAGRGDHRIGVIMTARGNFLVCRIIAS